MSEKDVIVHFVRRDSYDKFPAGYVNFMKIRMQEYQHYFFISAYSTVSIGFSPLELYNDLNVYYYDNLREVFLNLNNMKLFRKCKKIIFSGLYPSRKKVIPFLILSGLASKIYIQFWEGDLSWYGNIYSNFFHPKRLLNKFIMHLFLKNIAGIINLIEGDYESLMQVFPCKTKHFIAPMTGDPMKKYDFNIARAKHNDSGTYKILVGHSAYPWGLHLEAFRLLEHLKNQKVEIICPLSYGFDDYREVVIEAGRNIFGDKFTPIINFMSRQEYINFLASCEAGIYLTNIQQGMGNISLLLRLGKKVYMREGTAMWKQYKETIKYTVYPVSELENITLEKLVNFPPELAYNNIQIAEERAASNYAVEQWRKVFED